MVNVREFIAGDFLTADIVKSWENKTAAIVDEGQLDSESFDHEVFRITVEKNGQQHSYTMNRTSTKACSEKWGEDTKTWIGKVLEFEIARMNVKGQFKDALFSKPKA